MATTPILDRAAALQQVGGDETMYEEFLQILLEEATAELEQMAQAIAQKDAESLEHAAHSLKGGAASMGANRISDVAYRLEVMGHDGDFAEAPAALKDLKREVDLLFQHVGK